MIRFSLRLVGLLICSFALQTLVPLVVYMAGDWWFKVLSTPNQPPTAWDWIISNAATGGVLLYFGLWLLRGSPSLAKWIIREVESQCAYCSVAFGGLTSSTCPQCGRLQPGSSGFETQGPAKSTRADVKNPDHQKA